MLTDFVNNPFQDATFESMCSTLRTELEKSVNTKNVLPNKHYEMV
jgi:hypothetical protein